MSFFPPRFHPNATLHLIVLSHHVIAFQHFLFLMTFTILRRSGEAFVEQSSTGSHPMFVMWLEWNCWFLECMLSTWHTTIGINLNYLVDIVFGEFLCHMITHFFFSFFIHCILWQFITRHIPHWGREVLWTTSLRVEYLHAFFFF